MKKLSLFILLIAASFPLMAQVDEYQEYLNSLKKEQEEFARQTEKNISNLQKEYQKFVTEANAEYAAFMKKEWELYENFKTQELTMTLPKIQSAPATSKSNVTETSGDDIQYKNVGPLPQVSSVASVNLGASANNYTPRKDNYVVRKVVTDSGVKEVTTNDFSSYANKKYVTGSNVSIDFYGRKLDFVVDAKLRLKNKSVKESDVADYFEEISTMTNETAALWKQIDAYVKTMGLNDWGYFCILRSLSENIFEDIDNRVLFSFYMLRNEGNFKARVARGKSSNKLTLLAAIDNKKEVYS